MFPFVRRLLGRETMADVAALFPDQLNAVKLILYKWFVSEFRKGLGSADDSPPVLAGQVVNYLMGEALGASREVAEPTTRSMIAAIVADVPEIAANLMRQDRGLREIVVQTLRMRLILNLSYRRQAATDSGLEQRIKELLGIYGAEFADEPSPGAYHALVSNLTDWANSPQFPGINE